MPIIGENAFSIGALATGDFYDGSFVEINWPPDARFLKIYLTAIDMRGGGYATAFISRIRRRLPDGSDETIELSRNTNAYFNHGITYALFTIIVRYCGARGLITIQRWS